MRLYFTQRGRGQQPQQRGLGAADATARQRHVHGPTRQRQRAAFVVKLEGKALQFHRSVAPCFDFSKNK